MLKRRLIPKLLTRKANYDGNFEACISRNYSELKMIGSLRSQLRIFESNKSDELMIINTNKTPDTLDPSFIEAIKESAEMLSTPIMAGGGINSVNDAAALIEAGVDKVLCGVSTQNHKLHTKLASLLGSQAVSISIDYTIEQDNIFVGKRARNQFTSASFDTLVQRIVDSGAGEIILNRIDFDGSQSGLDIQTLQTLVRKTPIPIILGSGAGKLEDFILAFESGADGVATGTFFAKMDQNPLQLRSRLFNTGVNIRK